MLPPPANADTGGAVARPSGVSAAVILAGRTAGCDPVDERAQPGVLLGQPPGQLRKLPVRLQRLSQQHFQRRRLSTLRPRDHASRNRHDP